MTTQPEPAARPQPAPELPINDRNYMETLNHVFDKFALKDQKDFYKRAVKRYDSAGGQVNNIRAGLSFLTGAFSAVAGLMVAANVGNVKQCLTVNLAANMAGRDPAANAIAVNSCDTIRFVVLVLILFTVFLPALGAAFNILSDLYQWDRLISTYDTALKNIEIADSHSPDPEMDDTVYLASLRSYAEGSLGVMEDETAQWGQLVRTPPAIEKFLAESDSKSGEARNRFTGQSGTPRGTTDVIE